MNMLALVDFVMTLLCLLAPIVVWFSAASLISSEKRDSLRLILFLFAIATASSYLILVVGAFCRDAIWAHRLMESDINKDGELSKSEINDSTMRAIYALTNDTIRDFAPLLPLVGIIFWTISCFCVCGVLESAGRKISTLLRTRIEAKTRIFDTCKRPAYPASNLGSIDSNPYAVDKTIEATFDSEADDSLA